MNDGINISNTFALEQRGWKGLGIEVNDDLFEQAKRNRTCTVVNECVFSRNDEEKTLEIPIHNPIPGGNSLLVRIKDLNPHPHFANQFTKMSTFVKRTKTLTKIFEEQGVPAIIDYMSIDIEGADYDALVGLDFSKYTIKFLTIEWGGVDTGYLAQIQTLMESKGYKVHRMNKWDVEFVPNN